MTEQLYTVQETADVLRISLRRVHYMISQNTLRSTLVCGTMRRIYVSSVQELLVEGERDAGRTKRNT